MFKKLVGKLIGSKFAPRPNIIMIMLDQFRNDTRKAHPVFDKMQQTGVVFSNAITYAPYTLASLHATFTGLYGKYNGVDAYAKSDHYKEKECVSMTQYLKKAGYYTHGYTFSKILFPHAGFDNLNIVHEDEEKNILASHKKELEICFAQDRPFFCFLHYGEIHHEIVKAVIRKYDNFDTEYFGNKETNRLRYEDLAIAAGDYTSELLKTIEQHDTNGDTMTIVFTDHGGGIGEKPGEKSYGIYTYDYTICTWAYFIFPKLLPKNTEISTQVRTIDILPTILDILKISPSYKNRENIGKSLLPLVYGQESGHRDAFSETGGVEGPWPSPNNPNIKCYRDGKWKLIYNSTINQYELYDIETDPNEIENRYFDYPERAEELLLKLVEFL